MAGYPSLCQNQERPRVPCSCPLSPGISSQPLSGAAGEQVAVWASVCQGAEDGWGQGGGRSGRWGGSHTQAGPARAPAGPITLLFRLLEDTSRACLAGGAWEPLCYYWLKFRVPVGAPSVRCTVCGAWQMRQVARPPLQCRTQESRPPEDLLHPTSASCLSSPPENLVS